MRLTITGPGAVGKSEVSKLLSRVYKVDYIDPKRLLSWGSNNNGAAYSAAASFYEETLSGFVFDLPVSIVNSREHPGASSRVRNYAKHKSIVVGLLPFGSPKRSIDFLFRKERQNPILKGTPSKELRTSIIGEYDSLPSLFSNFCDFVVHVGDMYPEEVAKDVIQRLTGHNTQRGRPKKTDFKTPNN